MLVLTKYGPVEVNVGDEFAYKEYRFFVYALSGRDLITGMYQHTVPVLLVHDPARAAPHPVALRGRGPLNWSTPCAFGSSFPLFPTFPGQGRASLWTDKGALFSPLLATGYWLLFFFHPSSLIPHPFG
jgi:hypothetical protein